VARQWFVPFKQGLDSPSHERNWTSLEEFLNSLEFRDAPGGGGSGEHHLGSGPPGAADGQDGDVWFDITNGKIYVKEAGGWTLAFDALTETDKDQILALIAGRVNWRDEWVQQTYLTNDMVRDGAYTMIANKNTNDKAAPVPTGSLQWLITDNPAWSPLEYTGSVVTGVRVQPPAGRFFEVSEYRVWIPDVSPNASYQVVFLDQVTGIWTVTSTFTGEILPVPGWFNVPVQPSFIGEADDFVIALLAANSAGSTDFNHPWVYTGTSQGGDPGLGNTTRDNQHTVIRISTTDDDGTPRTAELDSVVLDTNIRVVDESDLNSFFEYVVTGVIPGAAFYEYNVSLLDTGLGGPGVGNRCQIYFEIPIALPAQYVSLPNHWAASPALSGYLQFDELTGGVEGADAYGVDLQIQEFSASDDWDLVAIAGAGGGGGGDGPTSVLQQLESWPTGPTHLELVDGQLTPYFVVGNVLTVGAGRGVIMDSYTDPENIPVIIGLDWAEQSIDFGVVLDRHISYVYIDGNSLVQFDTLAPDAATWRKRMYLGRIFHDVTDGSLGPNFRPWHAIPNQAANSLFDFIRAAGGAFLFNGADVDAKYPDLTYAITESQWFSPGESWFQDRDDPNIANNPASDPAVFDYMLSDGTVVLPGDTTLVDPTQYESAPGVLTAIPGAQRASIQRLYAFINGQFIMTYGQEYYNTLEDAVLNLSHDIQQFDPPAYVESEGQIALIAYFIMGASVTDLSDGTDVVIINDERLPIGGGGGHVHTHDATYLKLSGGTMAGDINMDSNDLYGLVNPPSQLTSAVSLDYLQDVIGLYLPLTAGSGEPLTGDLYIDRNSSGALRFERPDTPGSQWYMGFNTSDQFWFRHGGALALGLTDQGIRVGLDGSREQPSITFQNDPDTGFWRLATNAIGFAAGGVQIGDWRSTYLLVGEGNVDDPFMRPAGSLGNPTFSFFGDQDTGIYRHGTNSFALVSGGVAKLWIDSHTSIGEAGDGKLLLRINNERPMDFYQRGSGASSNMEMRIHSNKSFYISSAELGDLMSFSGASGNVTIIGKMVLTTGTEGNQSLANPNLTTMAVRNIWAHPNQPSGNIRNGDLSVSW